MKPAPVILFVYNRPELARQTLQSLRANKLAGESVLHIFCDGAREDAGSEERRKIEEVRSVVRGENWCAEVQVHERSVNLGLARSVIEGVSAVLAASERVIVIEDDVLLSPYFLQYMNDALEKHSNDQNILSVGSWNYFCKPAKLKGDSFYFRYPDSIAWATYARSWQLFEHNAATALRKLDQRGLMKRFNGDGATPYFETMLRDQVQGRINSWAIRWTATSVLNNMLNVFPAVSMSKHMGFGASATHEKSAEDYNSDLVLSDRRLLVKPAEEIKESEVALSEWKKFVKKHFMPARQSLVAKTRLTAYRTVRRLQGVIAGRQSEAGKLIKSALAMPRYQRHKFQFRNYKVEVSDFLSVAQQIREYFEEERLKFQPESETPQIIDCGSNVGISVLYFSSLFPKARITAYEADPGIYSLLKTNLTQNKVADVTAENKAVWIHDRGVSFSADGADGGAVSEKEGKVHVSSVRLRDVLSMHASIDLLKMDIEGAECEVLLDCGETLAVVRRLFVEYHSFADAPQRLSQLLDLLQRAGFRYHIKDIGSQAPKPFEGVDSYNGMDMQLEIYAINTNKK